MLEVLDARVEPGRADAEIKLAELEELVRALAGADALEVARARAARLTERELAEEPGWTPQRVGAAARRLRRARRKLSQELLDD